MILRDDFPRLTDQNHRITSPATPDYTCIAWSVRDVEHWWQPGVHWPIATINDDYGIGILEQAFLSLGFEDCEDTTQISPGTLVPKQASYINRQSWITY